MNGTPHSKLVLRLPAVSVAGDAVARIAGNLLVFFVHLALNVAFFQFVVSLWQTLHGPPQWLAGARPAWQLEQSVPPIWLWSKRAFFQWPVSLWQLRQAPAQ